jgi:adenine phosphoribosyltransferase
LSFDRTLPRNEAADTMESNQTHSGRRGDPMNKPTNTSANGLNIKDYIRGIPDFPKPGILFYDISTLLSHAEAWAITMGRMARQVGQHYPDVLAGIESRGFLVAAPLALKLGCGFVMIRKKGKLPGKTVSFNYDLEYGTDTIQIQADAVKPGEKVVILDDLLATGGTMKAAIDLFRKVGAEVTGAATIIELTFLNGRSKLDVPYSSLIAYDS